MRQLTCLYCESFHRKINLFLRLTSPWSLLAMIAAYEAGLQTGLPAADSAGPSSDISGCGSTLGAGRRPPPTLAEPNLECGARNSASRIPWPGWRLFSDRSSATGGCLIPPRWKKTVCYNCRLGQTDLLVLVLLGGGISRPWEGCRPAPGAPEEEEEKEEDSLRPLGAPGMRRSAGIFSG